MPSNSTGTEENEREDALYKDGNDTPEQDIEDN